MHLLGEVTVSSERVFLADLLPNDAGPQVKSAAGKVFLGRAPLPGSVHVFEAGQVKKTIARYPARGGEFAGLDIPAQVVVRRIGRPLDINAVQRSLAGTELGSQIDWSVSKIVLPADFTTLSSNPELKVTGMARSSDHRRWLAGVRCRDRSACSSFLAEIELRDPALEVMANRAKPELDSLGASSVDSAIAPDPGPVLVQPGRLALLVIEGKGYRITEPVMPLKRARLGELVRVSDPRTRQSWPAEVEGAGRLRLAGKIRRDGVR